MRPTTFSRLRRYAGASVALAFVSQLPDVSLAEPVGVSSSASEHAEVIAQGVVEFPAGEFHWAAQQVDLSDVPYSFNASPPTFWHAVGPGAVLVSASTHAAFLAAGEATFVPSGADGEVAVTPAGPGGAWRITFEAGSGAGSFNPGGGHRDVNLVRDVLAPDESLTLTSEFPVLVIVTEGDVVTADGADVAANPNVVAGGTTLVNEGSGPAVVVAGVVASQLPNVANPAGPNSSTVDAAPSSSTTQPSVPSVSTAGSATTTPSGSSAPASTSTTATTGITTTAGVTSTTDTTITSPTTVPGVPPSAADDYFVGLVIATGNVLSNDSLGDPSATIVAVGAGSVGSPIPTGPGVFTLSANGHVEFVAVNPSLGATFSTTYTIENATGTSTATILLTADPLPSEL